MNKIRRCRTIQKLKGSTMLKDRNTKNNREFWEYYEKLYDHQGDETEIWATQGFLLDEYQLSF
ncbi:hypothetical protein [Paenibacillus sp. FSL R7-0337]|uniref:hypothetical protein n=1 Tax=unclassified Paenibacillus TaxID=185978 RepID=UPI00096F3CE8|nr:hypothetical protein [Paenibacillus sp. FSL R7-0337]OMF91357.1 hypothetical protein BK147_21860 [Paenibacillus sp. FSL R7-0337]